MVVMSPNNKVTNGIVSMARRNRAKYASASSSLSLPIFDVTVVNIAKMIPATMYIGTGGKHSIMSLLSRHFLYVFLELFQVLAQSNPPCSWFGRGAIQ